MWGLIACPVDYCMHWQRDTFGKIMLNNTTGNDVRNTLPLSQKLSLCEYALSYSVLLCFMFFRISKVLFCQSVVWLCMKSY